MISVRILPSDHVVVAKEGEDLLEIVQRAALPIATSCGGTASCGQCLVEILRGADQLTPLRQHEAPHLECHPPSHRLACQARIRRSTVSPGEIVVRIASSEATLPG